MNIRYVGPSTDMATPVEGGKRSSLSLLLAASHSFTLSASVSLPRIRRPRYGIASRLRRKSVASRGHWFRYDLLPGCAAC